ncbi:MAG: dihydroneopterin aldolase [Candidatus Hydrogenedens sp.]|nr:dihydroneopterin aldolase [Candidatus Hydrogenedentota bacterium]NLF56683.1 dihydroneopterin aldolase [Candidatus Hydrogenedens sp.]
MDDERLDKIHIRDLQVRCIVGIYPEERAAKQDVILNITLHADYRAACKSDDIADTVDYKKVKKQIFEMVEHSEFFLVERLAEETARLCLSHGGVARADVTVDKPGALRFARSVAVEISRTHDSLA